MQQVRAGNAFPMVTSSIWGPRNRISIFVHTSQAISARPQLPPSAECTPGRTSRIVGHAISSRSATRRRLFRFSGCLGSLATELLGSYHRPNDPRPHFVVTNGQRRCQADQNQAKWAKQTKQTKQTDGPTIVLGTLLAPSPGILLAGLASGCYWRTLVYKLLSFFQISPSFPPFSSSSSSSVFPLASFCALCVRMAQTFMHSASMTSPQQIACPGARRRGS